MNYVGDMGRMIEMRCVGFSAMLSFVVLAIARQAWAGWTVQSYQGHILLLLFLGVCMLIIVSQMVPALILILEFISGIARRIAARKQAVVVGVSRDKKL